MTAWRWPLVVLAGFAMLAAALFLRREAPATAPPAAAPVIPERIDPPGSTQARAAVAPIAQSALEAVRGELAKACPQARGTFSLRMLFGADGHELRRSVRQDSGPPDQAASGCLNQSPLKLTVPATGEVVSSVVTLTLP